MDSGVGAERPAVVLPRRRPRVGHASVARALALPVASSIAVGQAGDLLVEAFRSGTAAREMLGCVQGPRAHRLVLGVRQDLLPARRPRPGECVASRGRVGLRARRSCVLSSVYFECLRVIFFLRSFTWKI